MFPLALLAALPAAGCSGSGPGDPDDLIRQRVADQAGSLAGLYAQAAAARPGDPRPAEFREHHVAHRALLLSGAANPATADPAVPAEYQSVPALPQAVLTGPDANLDAGTAADAGSSAAVSAAAKTATASAAAAPPSGSTQPTAATLVAAERAASAMAEPDLPTASGRLAGLLVDIAACRAVHCAALDPASQTQQSVTDAPELAVPTPGDLSAAQAILGAEHAAVYAYGALTPHLSGTQRTQAHGMYELHRQIRDGLESGIAAHGATPVAMAAAYAFPQQPTDPAGAQALAVYVETRVAAVCADAAVVASPAARPYAAWATVGASLRAYAWGRAPAAFPATFST